MPVSVKMDPRMKKALEKLAEEEFSSVAGIVKKAINEYLKKQGVDWREEEPEE